MLKKGDKVKIPDMLEEGICLVLHVKRFNYDRSTEVRLRYGISGRTSWWYEYDLELIEQTHVCPLICKECLKDVRKSVLF